MIGILCALDKELELLQAQIEAPEARKLSGYEYIVGSLRGRKVVLCKCGVGKVNAAVCAQTMIMTWPLKLMINSGVAGALREPFEIGDICVARDLVQHDVDTSAVGDPVGFVSTVNQTYFRCAEWAVSSIIRAAQEVEDVRALPARIASGDQFITDQQTKDRIIRLFDASACEMEGGAIAQVCLVNEIPCCILRAISDGADDGAALTYAEFAERAAHVSAKAMIRYLEAYA